jgi:hypothetical protein
MPIPSSVDRLKINPYSTMPWPRALRDKVRDRVRAVLRPMTAS